MRGALLKPSDLVNLRILTAVQGFWKSVKNNLFLYDFLEKSGRKS